MLNHRQYHLSLYDVDEKSIYFLKRHLIISEFSINKINQYPVKSPNILKIGQTDNFLMLEKVEGTKRVITSRKSKKGSQYNGQKKQKTNDDPQGPTQKTKD